MPGGVSTAGSTGGPQAYLNYLMFDRNFNPISIATDQSQTNFVRMSTAAREYGQDAAHEKLSAAGSLVKQPGYMYIYLSMRRRLLWKSSSDDFRDSCKYRRNRNGDY